LILQRVPLATTRQRNGDAIIEVDFWAILRNFQVQIVPQVTMKSIFQFLPPRIIAALLFLGTGLALVQPCRGASVGFENTGSLAQAREDHTATLLPDGKVLVAGGYDGHSALASAEVYDPASRTWAGTGNDLVAEREGARGGRTRELL